MKDTYRVFFIGIGGIGMSSIARYMLSQGKEVYGYDKTETSLTKTLVSEGMRIHYEDKIDLIPEGIDLVVYTPAIPKDHVQLNYFLENGFEVLKRSAMLGKLSEFKKTIAIAGTHGKTSTSSMTAHVLKHCGEDVTAFIGGVMTNYESNFIGGDGDWMVVEADEYDRSFLTLEPDVMAIMSMDSDHLDIYGDEDMMHSAFEDFINKLRLDGTVIMKKDILQSLSDEVIENLAAKNANVILFSIEEDTEVAAFNVRVDNRAYYFDYETWNESIRDVRATLPGRHNIENALVAMTVARELDKNLSDVHDAIECFNGIKRRFEKIYENKDVIYYDDYAHHPTELRSSIGAAKELFPNKKITGVFQPHLFSRTRDFVDGFAKALDMLDEIILMDIYPAREKPLPGVSSKIVFDRMKNKNKIMTSKEDLMGELEKRDYEVLMTLGAGDIDVFVDRIKELLQNRKGK